MRGGVEGHMVRTMYVSIIRTADFSSPPPRWGNGGLPGSTHLSCQPFIHSFLSISGHLVLCCDLDLSPLFRRRVSLTFLVLVPGTPLRSNGTHASPNEPGCGRQRRQLERGRGDEVDE